MVSALGTGLFEVFKIVFTKGLEKGIVEPAAEPLRDWVSRGYDEKKDKAALDAALLAALDDLDNEQGLGAADRLVAGWKVLDASPAARQGLAAAALEMASFEPQRIPAELLKELNLEQAHRDLLARFLFRLRSRLGGVEKYKDGIAYADRLEARWRADWANPRSHRFAGAGGAPGDRQRGHGGRPPPLH